VHFKLQAFIMEMIIYKVDSSPARLYTCPDQG
jgi:hypothetical protein